MSAQLAGAIGAGPSNSFHASLVLAAGVTAHINAPTLAELSQVVAKLQPTEAVNDPGNGAQGRAPAPSSTGTAAKTDAPKQTAAASTPAAAPAAAQSQASTAAGDAGNATSTSDAAAQTASSSAANVSSGPTLPADAKEAFDIVKKAFLALSTKTDGRAKCEAVLKPFNLTKLSEAKPEQYAAVLGAIQKASA